MRPLPGPGRLRRLHDKKQRESQRLFLVEGEAPIRESPIEPLAVYSEADDVRLLSTLTTPTGPVALFPFVDVAPETLLENLDRIVLLDGVQDPGNVGTAIRSAHAFDAGVALTQGAADLYNPKTVRSTMGSIFHAPVAREVDVAAFLPAARAAGFLVLGAVPDGRVTLRGVEGDRFVFVVGTEGRGISDTTLDLCDGPVSIPSRAASLNAGVAASILLYEAYMRVLP